MTRRRRRRSSIERTLGVRSDRQASAGHGWRGAGKTTRRRRRRSSIERTLDVRSDRQASAGHGWRGAGKDDSPQEAAVVDRANPWRSLRSTSLGGPWMAAEALKKDVRAWVSEGGSLTQAAEHPSGLCEPGDAPVASLTPHQELQRACQSGLGLGRFGRAARPTDEIVLISRLSPWVSLAQPSGCRPIRAHGVTTKRAAAVRT